MSQKKNSAGVSSVPLTHLVPETGHSEYLNTTRSNHTYCTIDTLTNGLHEEHDYLDFYSYPVRKSTTIRNLNNHQSPVYQNLLTPHAKSACKNNSRKQCCLRKRYLIIIIIVSLITSLTTVGWMSFKYIETMTYELSLGVGSHEICVECQSLREDSDEELLERLSRRVINSTTMCCAVTAGQMSTLIQLMSIREDRIRSLNEANRKRFKFIPVSAHVSVASVTNAEVIGESNVAIHTPSNLDKVSTHARGVTIYNNSVLIRHSGTYLVYVSLLLKAENNTTCSHEMTRVAITRVTGKVRTCLMEMFHRDMCLGTPQTLYSSGLFRLFANDKIFANLSGNAKVKDGQKLSFLGLAMFRSN